MVPGGVTQGIKHVSHDDTYLCRDEQDRWCFIPSLMGEALGQLAAWNVMFTQSFQFRPVAGVVSSACLHRPAYVGETLLLTSFIEALDESAVRYRSVALVGDEVVFTIDSALGPLLPMGDFIEKEAVEHQFAEINRPGDVSCLPFNTRLDDVAMLTAPSSNIAPSMVFDGILESVPGVSLTAVKRVTKAAPYFPDHFPNKPVLPMSVLLECKLNLARDFVAQAGFETAYVVYALQKIKMNGFIHPGDVVFSFVTVKRRDTKELILSYRSEVDGKRVCVVEIVMKVKGDL